MYIGDYSNHRIRKVTVSTSTISTIAGIGSAGYSGDNGQATAAMICYPYGVNLDSTLNVYFGDFNGYSVIRKITVATGIISTVAGSASGGYNGDNIQATAAMLNSPTDVILDDSDNLYITDRFNHRIRKVDATTGVITTIVGDGTASSTGDGSAASSATINQPVFSRFDSKGNYYISEAGGNFIRKVTNVADATPTQRPTLAPNSASIITTIAGTGSLSYHEEDGAATSATFQPLGIAVDAEDNVYFNDIHNNVIRKVTVSTGIITTYAGSYSQGFGGDGGQATSATLCTPLGLCIDSSGTSSIHRLTGSKH